MDDILVPESISSEEILIDPDSRTILLNDELMLGVESDEEAERLTFRCPKIVGDDVDLSEMNIYINYENANGEKNAYLCQDKSVDTDDVVFSWLLSRSVTKYHGTVNFIVCAKQSDDEGNILKEWNTTICKASVLTGLETTEVIEQENADIIESILKQIQNIEVGEVDINTQTVTFEESSEKQNIQSGETVSTLFGKIKKWFADLKQVAFSGSYTDLSNTPTIPSKTSDLTNDSNFVTNLQLSTKLDKNLGADNNGKYLSVGDNGAIVPTDLPDISEPYTLPQATATTLGGIKAKVKTDETVEVAIDSSTGKLYVPTYPEGGSGGSGVVEKEWQLFKTITFDGTSDRYEYTDLDFTEFLFEGIGLINETGNVESSVRINSYYSEEDTTGVQIAILDSQKNSSPSASKYQRAMAAYNGLYWVSYKTRQSNNEENYYTIYGEPLVPYSVDKSTGKCKKLVVLTLATYTAISGTLRIYAR